ncbi:MAG: Cna B-type domain-containing protein [Clostridia bacterium]|nr:Cna B-type domain-containing protein [Clostridia bacterium]
MAKRRMAVIAVLICLCVWFSPCGALAASTADATCPIDTDTECSLTITCACDGAALGDVTVRLYNVADVSADFQFALNQKFEATGLVINGIKTNSEWNTVRNTLEAHIIADNIEADAVILTDENGQARFENLKTGLYLAIANSVIRDDITYLFESALVSLPRLLDDGVWQYDVSVASKSEMIPPSEQEEELKIVKLWKGDTGRNSRPTSIEVEIFKDGTSYETVVLSQENNWSYSWFTKEANARWTVTERNVSKEYTMTVEKSGNTFVMTNSFNLPSDPSDSPQTGDSFNVLFALMIVISAGCLLIILGIIGKRKAHDE